ncbi:hypothetical protein ABFV80_000015 [Vandammella animalimorsus]|uniref:hypothetical protein n=1 Tax=Vandammella animalimorsus TaxID=2029117 RepID=UPI00325A51A5
MFTTAFRSGPLRPLAWGLSLALLLGSASALAHAPRLKCQPDGSTHVQCEGGFSDGSDAKGVEISVLSYEDKPLWKGALDAQSRVRFERPKQDFYVRFEGGEGHTLEVDQDDIR